MKKLIYLLIAIVGVSLYQLSNVNGQGVGINPSGNPPANSAILDVSATDKGILIPRLTTTQRDAITNPAQALQIYNLTTKCLEIWENGLWLTTWCATCPTPSAVTVSSTPTSLCEGSTLTLTSGATYATNWSWTGPNGFNSTLQNPIISNIILAGDGVYSLTASNNCGSAAPVNTASVTVNTIPLAPTTGTQTPSQTQIVWNWNTVLGATGYKYNTSNNYLTASDNGLNTSYIQTGLTCNISSSLFVWAYNICGNSSALTLSQTTVSCCGGTITDSRDGKVYNTVQIGAQCWMKQNLNIGTRIDATNEQTNNSVIEKYCQGNSESNCNLYGGLYQWGEMVQYLNGTSNSSTWFPVPTGNIQGICPSGWHIPKDSEWCTLENTVETGTDPGCNAGGWRGVNTGAKMKVSASNTPPWDGNNSSGFSAVPSGARDGNVKAFYGQGNSGLIWSSTESNATLSWYRIGDSGQNGWLRTDYSGAGKHYGFAIRCVQD